MVKKMKEEAMKDTREVIEGGGGKRNKMEEERKGLTIEKKREKGR